MSDLPTPGPFENEAIVTYIIFRSHIPFPADKAEADDMPEHDTTSCLNYNIQLPFRSTAKAGCVPNPSDFQGIGAWADNSRYQYEGGSCLQDEIDLRHIYSGATRSFAQYFVVRKYEDNNIFRFLP